MPISFIQIPGPVTPTLLPASAKSSKPELSPSCRKLGIPAVIERIPAGRRYYVTLDIDGFDPSIAPGTGTPSRGFTYYEVLELLDGLARRGPIVGVNLVEVAREY